jgi:hypothetical protein
MSDASGGEARGLLGYPMRLALLALYVGLPVVGVRFRGSSTFGPRATTSHGAQQIAKAALVAVVTLAFACANALASRGLGAAGTRLELSALTFFVAWPMAGLLWLIHDLTGDPSYAGAVVEPARGRALVYRIQRFRTRLGRGHDGGGRRVGGAEGSPSREACPLRSNAQRLAVAATTSSEQSTSCNSLGSKGRETILAFLADPGSQYETQRTPRVGETASGDTRA